MRENIVVTRGDSRELDRQLFLQGLPIDLTGASVTMTVESLFTKTIGGEREAIIGRHLAAGAMIADSGHPDELAAILLGQVETMRGFQDWWSADRLIALGKSTFPQFETLVAGLTEQTAVRQKGRVFRKILKNLSGKHAYWPHLREGLLAGLRPLWKA